MDNMQKAHEKISELEKKYTELKSILDVKQKEFYQSEHDLLECLQELM